MRYRDAQLLLADKLGYPLWIPHPDEGASDVHRQLDRQSGVRIGCHIKTTRLRLQCL